MLALLSASRKHRCGRVVFGNFDGELQRGFDRVVEYLPNPILDRADSSGGRSRKSDNDGGAVVANADKIARARSSDDRIDGTLKSSVGGQDSKLAANCVQVR